MTTTPAAAACSGWSCGARGSPRAAGPGSDGQDGAALVLMDAHTVPPDPGVRRAGRSTYGWWTTC